MASLYIRYPNNTGGSGVSSINGETGAVNIVAGTGITVTPSGQNITIASTGSGVSSVTASDPVISSGGSTPNISLGGTRQLYDSVNGPSVAWQSRNLFDSFGGFSIDWQNHVFFGPDGSSPQLDFSTQNVANFNGIQVSGVADPVSAQDAATKHYVDNAISGAAITIGALDAQPENAKGLALVSNVLSVQSADSTHPGLVNNTTQTFSGNKTFSGQTAISNTSTTALTINSSAFVFDATNNTLGIGNAAPAAATFLDGINSSGATKRLLLTGYGTSSLVGFRTRLARGTSGSPTAVQTGDILGFFNVEGYGASQFPTTATGAITFTAGENFTNSSNLTYCTINTTATGAVTSTEAMRVASTGVTLGPQSSSTAIHTINGGRVSTTRTITANLTVDTTTSDYIILCNQSGAITITLPAPTNGRTLIIKDISGNASTNNITVARHASEMIEGVAASKIIQGNFDSETFVADGTNWWMI